MRQPIRFRKTQLLLIDACNIAEGGGGVLLKYLIRELNRRSVSFHVVAPERIDLPESDAWTRCPALSPIGKRRDELLRELMSKHPASCLFCFGNIPPRSKFAGCRVITFFQNAHLIRSIDKFPYGFKDRARYFLLSHFLRKRQNATDQWIFQTDFVRTEFCKFYKCNVQDKFVLPFFEPLEYANRDQEKRANAFIYVSSAPPHKNHSKLLDAWELLPSQLSNVPELRLTVPLSNKPLCSRIRLLNEQGIPVTNLGSISQQEVRAQLDECRFMIHPSLLETIGLGLVEGAAHGCKVLTGRLPYVSDVIKPSSEFDPFSASDIAAKVSSSLSGDLPATEIVIQNRIDDLIHLLTTAAS